METINSRLAALREVMRRERLAAFIFPSTDPHSGEYVPDHWKGREWISGFDGSAGTAVVTMGGAALWTDSRYFLAAAGQLTGTEYVLMRQGLRETPSISEWLGNELSDSDSHEIGVDGMACPYSSVMELIKAMREEGGITVRTNLDPLEQVWGDRPGVPTDKVFIQPLEYAGESTLSKIERVREALRDKHADGTLISTLDDIAWILNLRGNDVHCNPVFVSYLLISTTKVTLYIDRVKLTDDVVRYLRGEGVDIDSYRNIMKGVGDYDEYNMLVPPDTTNYTLYNSVHCQEIVSEESPVPSMKAVKNDTEITGFHKAMVRDGIAMVRFLRWLKPAVMAGGQTEMSLGGKLASLREEQPLYMGLSFDTIVGYEAHGAIVHYEATKETDAAIEPRGLVLIDSGAQYQDGTTDITRTIALGETTDEQRSAYTLVLKGHIQLELCKFPQGACGSQIDALAREPMWREGLNFLHGTGHGVGSFLNVHEGPHQIRMEWKPAPFMPGMTVTDEPGLYLAGKFGVRIENTLLTIPYKTTDFGTFLGFESLTLCPIDTAPIMREMLAAEEMEWLNAYHETVYQKLSPHLAEGEKEWLREATRPI